MAYPPVKAVFTVFAVGVSLFAWGIVLAGILGAVGLAAGVVVAIIAS